MSSFANTVIPYYPALSVKLGSVTSAILYRQLLYWFKKMEYKPFYKFLKPCEHGSYKTGESWTEELSMTETEFRTAFQKIGIAYKSKKDFDNAENKFVDDKGEEKYFCSYIDRLERKTYYFMNNELVKKLDFEINYSNFPINEENYFLEIKKPISRNEESQFLETKKAISNNSRLPVEYQENKTGNVRESILKLKELLETQFNNKLTPTQIDKLVMLSVQHEVNPLEIYNNSDYLRGFVDKKPTWRMWTANAEATIQKMKAGEYVNKDLKQGKQLDPKTEFFTKYKKSISVLEVAYNNNKLTGDQLIWAEELLKGEGRI